jgi:hypothetical protein
LQIGEVDELIGLTAKLVGHHRWVGGKRRHDAHALALMLERLDE